MIRKVPVKQLRPGMFISHIPANWFAHPFWRPSFKIRSHTDIDRLIEAGVGEVLIDTGRGLDVAVAPSLPRPRQSFAELDRRLAEVAAQRKQAARDSVSLSAERQRAFYLRQEAAATMQALMEAARLGERIDLRSTEAVIARITESVRRHPDALIPLLHIKERGSYAWQHSLSTAAMTIALGSALDLGEQELLEVAQGALLQDVGKARISERVLNKATPLTDLEYLHVRSHVDKSQAIVEDARGASDVVLEVVSQHHERIDGTGYPHRLIGAEVSLHAQVAAIVDVYDALTSDTPYRRHLEPAVALNRLYGLSGTQFRGDLVQAFVKALGIYPVGSLVRLDNGYLAVVVEQHRDQLLKPVVRTIYNTRNHHYLTPERLDLARRREAPAIVGVESWASWNIDPRRWQPQ